LLKTSRKKAQKAQNISLIYFADFVLFRGFSLKVECSLRDYVSPARPYLVNPVILSRETVWLYHQSLPFPSP
jgi:hypothetical protein